MAALETVADVEAELAATATYAADENVSLAKRRESALTRKLDFAQSTSRGELSISFDCQRIETQLTYIRAWIAQRATPTDAQLLQNPSVLHTDFSTFRGYQ